MLNGYKIIDLSVDFSEDPLNEPWPPKIEVSDHYASALKRAEELSISIEAFPDSMHLLTETVHAITHVGTHLDAPLHCGPRSGNEPAMRIGDIPLEWCIAPGVRLDLRHKSAGELITVEDLEESLDKIKYRLNENDIVLLWTGCDKHLGSSSYLNSHPGMGEKAIFWLVDQGIKIMGVDSYGLDRPFKSMVEAYRKGEKNAFFPAHYACREKAFYHIEKLCNLEKLPSPTGFFVIALPIKIPGAGAAWTRVVALTK